MLSTNQCQALALSYTKQHSPHFCFYFITTIIQNTIYHESFCLISQWKNLIQDDKEISLLHHTVSYHIIIQGFR